MAGIQTGSDGSTMKKGYELAVALLGILERKPLIQKALDYFQHVFKASNATLYLDNERTQLYDKIGYREIEKKVLASMRDEKIARAGKTGENLAGYFLAVPILKKKSFAGAIFLYSSQSLQEYSEEVAFSAQVLEKALSGLEQHATMEKMATHDQLTKLMNRQHFSRSIKDKLTGEVSIAMLDIDNFKEYNDTKGHIEGDRLLQKIAGQLKEVKGTVCRYGGEEFAMFLAMPAHPSKEEMEKLRQRLEKGERTVSIGLATKLDERVNYEDLLQEADKALYKAKDKGKNKVVHHVLIGKNLVVDTEKASELGR